MPLARWNGVPAAAREPADARFEAGLAKARADEIAAIAAVAAARRALTVAPPRPDLGAGSSWLGKAVSGKLRKASALAAIDRARVAALQADLAWRLRRVDAAIAHIAMVEAEREFKRATMIDDHSTEGDTLEIPKFRGQLARAQAVWYPAEAAAEEARVAMVRANEQLAVAKESFAQLLRVQVPETPFQLSKWARASDVRRRGLQVTEPSFPMPCKRRTCFRQPSADTIYLTIATSRRRR